MNIQQLFSDYTFQVVAFGSTILGMISGIVGCYAVLAKKSLLGDGIAHASLPGVIIIFLIFKQKASWLLLLGAFISGLLATLIMVIVTKYTKLKFDSSLAVIMSSFFGLGMVLLTYVQKIPTANQAGLKRFIYGQASTLLIQDVYLMIISSLILFILIIIFYRQLKLICFDSLFAKTLGFSTNKINYLLSLMIVTTIILGLQTVGVVLVSALIIAPAIAARQWTNKLNVMQALAAIFGGVAGFMGTLISSLFVNIPTGPAIVVCISVIALISLLFAYPRGLIYRWLIHRQQQKEKERGKLNESTIRNYHHCYSCSDNM